MLKIRTSSRGLLHYVAGERSLGEGAPMVSGMKYSHTPPASTSEDGFPENAVARTRKAVNCTKFALIEFGSPVLPATSSCSLHCLLWLLGLERAACQHRGSTARLQARSNGRNTCYISLNSLLFIFSFLFFLSIHYSSSAPHALLPLLIAYFATLYASIKYGPPIIVQSPRHNEVFHHPLCWWPGSALQC